MHECYIDYGSFVPCGWWSIWIIFYIGLMVDHLVQLCKVALFMIDHLRPPHLVWPLHSNSWFWTTTFSFWPIKIRTIWTTGQRCEYMRLTLMWFCNLVSHMRTLFALPSAHISTRPAEMWLQLTSFAFTCSPCGTYLARGNSMWKHMNQKHIAIHCYVISTRVIFVRICRKETTSSNMENEQNVILQKACY